MNNVHMTLLRFEWEPRKASANLNKHGISFEEAKSVFYDESAKLISDPDHSEDKERFILLGVSHSLRVILVCHCYRSERKEYDFSKARKNPYASMLKKPITIRLDEDSVNYFKTISEEVGIPYQSLINLYLRDCAASHKKLNLSWK